MESEPPVDQSEVRLEVNDSASVEVEQKDTESSEPQWTAFDNQNEVSSSENWADFSKPTASKMSNLTMYPTKLEGITHRENDHDESKDEETNHNERVEDTLVGSTDEDKKGEHEGDDVGNTKDDKLTNHSEDGQIENEQNDARDESQEDYEGKSSITLLKND